MKDPIVDEVRRFRDEHAKQFNYDLDAICEDYKTHQIGAGKRLVRLESKKIAINADQLNHSVTEIQQYG